MVDRADAEAGGSAPLVSIAVLTANHRRFVGAALQSLLAQDHPRIEITILDNASTDGTDEVCRDLAARDARLRYVRSETARGMVASFNDAWQRAAGTYFMWPRDDDLWEPAFVSECTLALAQHPEAVLAYSRTSRIDNENRIVCEDQDGLRRDGSDWMDAGPFSRYARLVSRLTGLNAVHGIMRLEAVRAAGGMRAVPGAERVLLADLVLQGSVQRVPGRLHYRREDVRQDSEDDLRRREILSRGPLIDAVRRSRLGPFSKLRAIIATLIASHRRSRDWPRVLMPFVLAYRFSWRVRAWPWPRADQVRRHNERMLRANPNAAALHFFPHSASPMATIWKVAEELGLRIVRSRQAGALNFAWHLGTIIPREPIASISASRGTPINASCLDTSKTTVDRTWREVAGYGLDIDPTKTDGPLVVKSDANGTHDGRIVIGTILDRKRGKVYQRLIDNSVGTEVVRYRTVVIRRRVIYVYVVRAPVSERFGGNPDCALVTQPEEVFSETDLRTLAAFVDRLGMDYGELDVLRDFGEGRIYVVDANGTPSGPPQSLSPEESRAAIRKMAEIFSAMIDEAS
jgi:hypothetical protein